MIDTAGKTGGHTHGKNAGGRRVHSRKESRKTGGHTHGAMAAGKTAGTLTERKQEGGEYTHGKKAGDDGHTEGGTGGKSFGHTA